MNKNNFLSQFTEQPLFTKQSMIVAAKRLEMPSNTLNSSIKRSLDKKELIALKRGFYITQSFFNIHRSELDYIFYLATKLLEPSYISRESALQYYGLLTEANNTVITCVSLSTTRKFDNRLGIFEYRNIKDSLFKGYVSVQKNFNFYIAEPHKAVFDFLYFRIPIKDLRNQNAVIKYLDEFRIDFEDMGKMELDKFYKLISKV